MTISRESMTVSESEVTMVEMNDTYDKIDEELSGTGAGCLDIHSPLRSSMLYVGAFGVIGQLVALTTFTPFQLAANVGKQTTEIGATLLTFGIGLFLGVMSLKSKSISVDILMLVISAITVVVLIALPFNRSFAMLWFYQFILGLCLSAVETGAMFLIRKINGKDAGVWLGLTGSSLSIGFFIVPLVMLITDDNIYAEYFMVAVCMAVLALLLLYKVISNPDLEIKDPENKLNKENIISVQIELQNDDQVHRHKALEGHSDDEAPATDLGIKKNIDSDDETVCAGYETPSEIDIDQGNEDRRLDANAVSSTSQHYHVEFVIFAILFIFVGMENSIGVYLQQYLDEAEHLDTGLKNSYQTVFICLSSLSKFIVPLYQYYFPKPYQIRFMLNICNCLNVICVLVWVIFSDVGNANQSLRGNSVLFYFFLAMNGLFTGGSMSLMYDVVNSLTFANRTSTMIMTSGIYIGSSLYPWLLSVIWESGTSDYRHEVYPYSTLAMAILVTCLCPVLPFVSYIPNNGDEVIVKS
jgi:hypothetical protein